MSTSALHPLPVEPIPRITLRQNEAAAALGVSIPRLMELVEHDGLPVVRRGRTLLFPVADLARWASEQAASGDR